MNKNHVRVKMVDILSGLLMGPMDQGETLESPPADTYLTGILWPRGAPMDAKDDDAGDGEAPGGMDESEASVPGYRAKRPCSIGITFAADSDATLVVGTADTARYVPTAIEPGAAGEAKNGKKAGGSTQALNYWVRRPLSYSLTISPAETRTVWKQTRFTTSDGDEIADSRVAVHVRRRVEQGKNVFTVTLINLIEDEEAEGEGRDARCLFQAGLVISARNPDGSPAIRPRFQVPADEDDEDALTNALLYRDEHEFAVGHGVAAVWTDPVGKATAEVRTSWLPEAVVTGTSPDGSEMLKSVLETHPGLLRADFLQNEDGREDVLQALQAFTDCYGAWIEKELNGRLNQFQGDRILLKAAAANLKRCGYTLERMRAGVATLRGSEQAWQAFALSNRAMNRQSLFPAREKQRRKPLVWRPFQLAFMLLVIPGIVDPADGNRNCMDLLWFPTGGGKTEAYLGITAFQIFFRRLSNAQRRKDGGVDVIMRYTLRLLTVQQFQRAAALITACDMMRAEDKRLGSPRISLGLYVGGEATPNKMEDARKAITEERQGESPKSTPRQLLRCPVCGSELQSAAYRPDPLEPRIDIACGAAGCETQGRSLPILTVDETIYAAPPSLLIGTIDKFAQIPRRTDIRRLFGLDGGVRPGLIIQDELHLISGPLGSMAGLYETVVDLLCSHDGVRPKIIGSTATIGQAGRQVEALFDRSVLQFPPPGFDAGDSFFAVRDSSGPDRLYVGVSTAGRSPKFALQAAVATLLQGAEGIRASGAAKEGDIDPYWTCVSYFNSLRELGGAYVLMQDDVPRQMQFLATRMGIPPRLLEMQPEELSSRVASRQLPQVLLGLEAPLAVNEDPYAEKPKDTVLASNMISVGVDVPRLGLMVVNGQPKSTAEYIQASSRVGRGMPGLVVTLYNFGRPRDLSHFEHFRGYHAALYRRVEATSVTPWAPRARDKALHAVFIAAARHLVPGLSGDDDAVAFDPAAPEVGQLIEAIIDRIGRGSQGVETEDARAELREIVARWTQRSREGRNSELKLKYWEKKAPFNRTAPHLMCSAEEGSRVGTLAWATPNTMREVEPSTAFMLKRIQGKQENQDGN